MSPKSAQRGKHDRTAVGERRTRGPDGTGGGRMRALVRPQGSAQTRHRAGRAPEIESVETRQHPLFDATRRRTPPLHLSGYDALQVTPPGNGRAPVDEGRYDRPPPGQPFHHLASPRLLGAATAGT